MKTFIFPKETYEFIKDRQNLAELIEMENKMNGSRIIYNYYTIKESYLYAKCKFKGCKAEFRFKRKDDQEPYKIYKEDRSHQHSQRSSFKNNMEEFIRQLPLTISISTAKELVIRKFKASQSQFYYVFKKVKNQKISYQQLVHNLNEKDCEIRSDPFYEGMNELPELMLIVTPKMKENFHKYGHWVGFDFTFNLIQQNHQNGKNWKVGCLMGISGSKRMVPYGLVLSTQETQERFYQIFKTFFDMMKKSVNVIISDEDHALSAAVRNLKRDNQFEGVHLLDCYHILRNVKKNLHFKGYWELFKELVYQQTQQEFQIKLNSCLEAINNQQDMRVLQRFVDNGSRYCFSQIPSVFFGFLPNTSMNEKIHDLLKSILPYSKPFTVAVTKIIEYLQDLGQRCDDYTLESLQVETLFNFPALKEVRFLVCKPIFSKIVHQISKSLSYEATFISEEQIYQIKTESLEFLIRKNDQTWFCSCLYLQKTGIPCSHLLKVIFLRKNRLSLYIRSHWLLDSKRANKGSISKGKHGETKLNEPTLIIY